MEKEKNIIIMENLYLKGNISTTEGGKGKEKSIVVMN